MAMAVVRCVCSTFAHICHVSLSSCFAEFIAPINLRQTASTRANRVYFACKKYVKSRFFKINVKLHAVASSGNTTNTPFECKMNEKSAISDVETILFSRAVDFSLASVHKMYGEICPDISLHVMLNHM